MKAPLRFRARRFDPTGRGSGPFCIEASSGGETWRPGIAGLDEDDVRRMLKRLHGKGCVIVSTPDFTFVPPIVSEVVNG